MKTIDTKGLKCPQPLIMLKEALQEIKAGERITLYTDNDTSLKNLVTYLTDHGVDPEVSTKGTTGLSTGIEVTPFPSTRQAYFHVTAEF